MQAVIDLGPYILKSTLNEVFLQLTNGKMGGWLAQMRSYGRVLRLSTSGTC